MKTVSLFAAIFLFFASQGIFAQNFDFRNTRWGMDSSQVKRSESAHYLYSRSNSLFYDGKLSNMEARIVYDFTEENQLYQTLYVLTLPSKNPSLYVNEYIMLQDLLTSKYKDPYRQLASTINGKTITQEEWASNLISDNLNLETRWKTDRTDIILSLYSISDELIIEIKYTSIQYFRKADDEKRGNLLKEL
jgi:hypothetical protein